MLPAAKKASEKVGETKGEKPAPQVMNVYNLHGTHSRVNIRSNDQSLNISNVTSEELFLNLREHIEENVNDEADRKEILERLTALEKTTDKATFLGRYQEFIAAAANHMTLIASFIPTLTQLSK